MERLKRIFGCAHKMKHTMIRIKTDETDHSNIPELHHSWENMSYQGAVELLPNDARRPLGRYVVTTHYVDANLYHDLINGKSVTGVLHLANQTHIDSFSKPQSTVETATYGSELSLPRQGPIETKRQLRLYSVTTFKVSENNSSTAPAGNLPSSR
jgi:dTDP-D-glucose 4,6-dehydratase